MDRELIQSYPSALAGVAVGMGYSGEAKTAVQLSTYIQNLGFQAIASMNDTALVIPYAVQAGLGEYGRNQMVITEEYRAARAFFENLHRSAVKARPAENASACGSFAASAGALRRRMPAQGFALWPTQCGSGEPIVNQGNVVKWTADCEKCFGYWAKLKTDCAICLRVCPYNKDFSKWYFRLGRRLGGDQDSGN